MSQMSDATGWNSPNPTVRLRALVAAYQNNNNLRPGQGEKARRDAEANRAAMIVEWGEEGCAGCRFFYATYRACHVSPPVQQRGDNHPWPGVRPGDWCSAFSSVFDEEA